MVSSLQYQYTDHGEFTVELELTMRVSGPLSLGPKETSEQEYTIAVE